jgi:hypothetical protein
VLDWDPQGTRKTKEDLEEVSCVSGTKRRRAWREVKRLPVERSRRKNVVEALCPYTGYNRN